MSSVYNPFSKEFSDIEASDLLALKTIAEGWYVEYKRAVPKASAIAKSITALANTYGGWVFYGIGEKSKEDAVADTFFGIENCEVDAALQCIRQAVANHSTPSPHFLVKALAGPVDSIGLEEGRSIIICNVPWGPEAPYVHKEGRIYRRVGDGSEPVPETDRYMLEKLWGRSEKIVDSIDEWVNRDLETSKAEENSAYVRLFLVTDFWGNHPPVRYVKLAKFRDILSREAEHSVPFDNIYRAPTGYIARQVRNNDPEMQGLTWRYHSGGDSEVVIPLSKCRLNDLSDWRNYLEGYDHAKRFLQICHKQGYKNPAIIDLNLLFNVLLGLTRHHVSLLKEMDWRHPTYAKLEISGIWRTIPFFDAAHVLDEFEQHGIALSTRDKITIHRGKGAHSFIQLNGLDSGEDEFNLAVDIASALFVVIAMPLGISFGDKADDDEPDIGEAMKAFLTAGTRAFAVEARRAQQPRD